MYGKVLKISESTVYEVSVEVDLSERLDSEIDFYEGNNYIGELIFLLSNFSMP